jgi:hypothetical protein
MRTIIAIFTLTAPKRALEREGWTRADLLDNAACFVDSPGSYAEANDGGEEPHRYGDGWMSRYWRGVPLRNATSFLAEDFPALPFTNRLVVCYDMDDADQDTPLDEIALLLEDELVIYSDTDGDAPYALTAVRVIDGSEYPDVVAEHRKRTAEYERNLAEAGQAS